MNEYPSSLPKVENKSLLQEQGSKFMASLSPSLGSVTVEKPPFFNIPEMLLHLS